MKISKKQQRYDKQAELLQELDEELTEATFNKVLSVMKLEYEIIKNI